MKINTILLFSLLWAAANLQAQIEKGITPIPHSGLRTPNSITRAVVVGISDYQDSHIPDLRFADKDAAAFADYLQSPTGGALPAENIMLLTNKAATTGAIAAAMDWLIAECKAGDRAVIYFSGHGDVETRTKFQRGFLLTYDSPPRKRPSRSFFLQDIISALADHGCGWSRSPRFNFGQLLISAEKTSNTPKAPPSPPPIPPGLFPSFPQC